MLVDARTLPADHVFRTDVCIVGSGPAGLTVAHQLLGQPFAVCVLESGGLEPDAETASLAELDLANDFLQVKDDAFNRRFGGNSAAWAIQLPGGAQGLRHRPLDEVDFERREWVPHSGWPFGRHQLMPFYERAHGVLGMGRMAYDGVEWADVDHPCLPLAGDRVTTRMFQFSLGKVFYEDRREELRRAPNVTVCLHTTALDLETTESGGEVTRVRAARPDGSELWIEARVFVLASGGLETAQLLLASDAVHTGGLGNRNDLVGRFFMDHPIVSGGVIVPNDPGIFGRAGLYDLRHVDGSYVMGMLGLTDEAVRDEDLLNISSTLFPRSKYLMPSEPVLSLRELLSLRALRSGTVRRDAGTVFGGRGELFDRVRHKVAGKERLVWYDFFQGGWSDPPDGRPQTFDVFDVVHQVEQLPDPDNRVVLSDQRDRLGRRRLRIETRWRVEEADGVMRSQEVFADAVERSGLGRFTVARDGDGPVVSDGGTGHHMGTTRMHADPRRGVLDPECRVHGVGNLFVASSSVFPTGGYANPTLTIVALAIRIADRVKASIGSTPVSGTGTSASAPPG